MRYHEIYSLNSFRLWSFQRPSTKERVDQAIAALNYRTDESARLLASHRPRRER